MKSWARRLAPPVAVLVAAGLLTACGGPDRQDLDAVRAAIRRTSQLANRFVYTETTAARSVEVLGLQEDDFRYKARLSIDGTAVYDEVVVDDAIAARALTPEGLRLYAGDSPETDDDAAVAAERGLRERRWVLDQAGAPTLVASASIDRDVGDDPIYDALTVLRYIDQVVLRENFVVKFEENDLDYRPQDDPFPTPEDGSGVTRYDVRPERLPRAEDAVGGNQPVPGSGNFRKMAIYVKDGLIFRVLEDIDVVSRLDTIRRNYEIDLGDDLSVDEQVRIAIEAINAVRRGQGEDGIRVRTMSLELLGLGEEVAVDLPAAAVEGDLSLLLYRGSDDLRPDRSPT